MPTVKYDVSNVDESGGFEHVQPGMYIGKIAEVNLKESKSGNGPMFEVIIQPVKTADGKKVKVKDKKKQVGRVYTYILLEHEPSDWKLKEFTKALGLKDKGSLNTDKLVGKEVQMNLKPDTDLEDRYRPRVGKLLALAAGAKSAPEDDDDDDEDEDEVTEYTQDDLAGMDADELEEVADELEVEMPAGKLTAVKKKKLIAALLEAQEEQAEDDDDDDEEDEDEDDADADADEDDDDEDDDDDDEDEDLEDTLNALDRKGLKAYIKENDLEIKVTTKMDEDAIREAIAEAVGGDEDDDDEPVDYTVMSMDALKKEAQERGISTKGSKKVLAGRLAKDDEDDNPF